MDFSIQRLAFDHHSLLEKADTVTGYTNGLLHNHHINQTDERDEYPRIITHQRKQERV